MKVLSNTANVYSEDYVVYEMSFSTAEIESGLFYEELSPEIQHFTNVEHEVEFRLIGDELMRVDRKNMPPGGAIIHE